MQAFLSVYCDGTFCALPARSHSASCSNTAQASKATLCFPPDEWPLPHTTLKIPLKKQCSQDHNTSLSPLSPLSSCFSHQPLPLLLPCHGRILRITQFVPRKAANQWAGNHYWSESEWKSRAGWSRMKIEHGTSCQIMLMSKSIKYIKRIMKYEKWQGCSTFNDNESHSWKW